MCYPTSDGSANQVLCTNGSGVLGWATVALGSTWSRCGDGYVYPTCGTDSVCFTVSGEGAYGLAITTTCGTYPPISGSNSGGNCGIRGYSACCMGVAGEAVGGYAVYGKAGECSCYGVYGEVDADGNYAVYGCVGTATCVGLGTNGIVRACGVNGATFSFVDNALATHCVCGGIVVS
jgi:hypothetical protein